MVISFFCTVKRNTILLSETINICQHLKIGTLQSFDKQEKDLTTFKLLSLFLVARTRFELVASGL